MHGVPLVVATIKLTIFIVCTIRAVHCFQSELKNAQMASLADTLVSTFLGTIESFRSEFTANL